MSAAETAAQAPGENLDYSHDWSADLDDQGSPSDTIASSSWSLSGFQGSESPGPTASGAVTQTNVTSVFVQGLVTGHVYVLTNTVTTAADRIFTHSWVIRCGDL